MVKSALVLWGVGAVFFMMDIHRASAETFTLNQVYSLALKKNEEIQIAQEEIRYAEREKDRVRSAVLPKLTVTGTYDRSPEETSPSGFAVQPEKSYGFEVKLEQSLFSGGKNGAGLRIADRGVQVAQKDLHLSGEALLFQVARGYYEMLKAQKNLEAQRRNVERLTEHRRLSELRYKVGEVTESVLLRAQAELASAQAEQVGRETDLAVKRRELAILAGLPEEFEIEEPPLPEIPGETPEQFLEVALKNRNDLKRNALQEEIAKEQVHFVYGNFLPSLTLEGTYFSRNQDPRSTFFIDRSWVVGAKIEFPIFEGGLRRAELAQARLRLSEEQLATAKLRKQIDLDVTRSFLNLEAITRVLESRQDQLRFANKNYEMVSKQFTFGVVTNTDLLDANQVLIEAERDVIGATYDRHLAILGLQRSAGVFFARALEAAQVNM